MKNFIIALVFLSTSCAMCIAAVTQQQFVIHFPTDEYDLDEYALNVIQQVNAVVKNHNGYYEVILDAHTDNSGTKHYNEELSMQRCISVKNYLVESGINENQITALWYGETKPVKSNLNDSGKQANRRVSITVKNYSWNNVKEMTEDFSTKPNERIINVARNEKIITDKGIVIHVPENTFVLPDGKLAKGDVTVKITEALDKASWIENGLTTISDKGILQTGGMFKIEAYQNGTPLQIQQGKEIKTQVPFNKADNDMELFYAEVSDNGNISWKEAKQPVTTTISGITLPHLKIDTTILKNSIRKYATARPIVLEPDTTFLKIPNPPTFRYSIPKEPTPPDKARIAKRFSFTTKIFTSKKKKAMYIEAQYAKEMKVYERNVSYYNKRMNRYCALYEKYIQDLKSYYEIEKGYTIAIAQARKHLQQQVVVYYTYAASKQMNSMLSKIYLRLKEGEITNPEYLASIKRVYHTSYKRASLSPNRSSISIALEQPNMKAMVKKFETIGISRISLIEDAWRWERNTYEQIYNDDLELVNMLVDAEATMIAERQALGLFNMNELAGYYNSSLTSLGWINIDKFMKEQQMITIDVQTKGDQILYVVIDDMNSILPAYNGKATVPVNANITLFSMSLIDGKPHYAIEKLKAVNNKSVELQYQQGLVRDIQDAIKISV